MMIIGGVVLLVAKSAFHEILAATSVGLGAVVLALGTVADLLDSILMHLRAKFPVEDVRVALKPEEEKPVPKPEPEVSWKSRGTK